MTTTTTRRRVFLIILTGFFFCFVSFRGDGGRERERGNDDSMKCKLNQNKIKILSEQFQIKKNCID